MLDLNVKDFIELSILQGRTLAYIQKAVQKNYPRAKMVDSYIRFHALQLKREGAITDSQANTYLHATSPKPKATTVAKRGRPAKQKAAVTKKPVKKKKTVAKKKVATDDTRLRAEARMARRAAKVDTE